MKRKFILSSILLIISLQCFAQWELKDTTEFSARQGLPNFFDKINTKQAVKIGFIGGSITAANGWRPKIVSWIEEQYAIKDLFSYSAAIGGTNSKYGVFRIDEHLLSKSDFDLIFIEFAVNDGGASSSDVEKVWKEWYVKYGQKIHLQIFASFIQLMRLHYLTVKTVK